MPDLEPSKVVPEKKSEKPILEEKSEKPASEKKSRSSSDKITIGGHKSEMEPS